MRVLKKPTTNFSRSIFTIGVTVIITLLIVLLLICFSFFVFIKDTEKEKKDTYRKTYSFETFIKEKVIISREERKLNFVKKSVVIFDKYRAPWKEEEKIRNAEMTFEFQEYFQIDGILAYSFFFIESGFDNNKVGKYGEITMAQFMQSTWAEVTKGKWYQGCEKDYVFVIECWFEHIRDLGNEFSGIQEDRLRKTFLAYNCGRETIRRLKSVKEVKAFKERVYKYEDGTPKESYDEKVFKSYKVFLNIKIDG